MYDLGNKNAAYYQRTIKTNVHVLVGFFNSITQQVKSMKQYHLISKTTELSANYQVSEASTED